MTTKSKYINTELFDAEIWNKEDFNRPSINTHFLKLLSSQQFDKAKEQLKTIKHIGFPDGLQICINVIEKIIQDFEDNTKNIDSKNLKKLTPFPNSYIEVDFKDFTHKHISNLTSGLYIQKTKNDRISSFDLDFKGLDVDTLSTLSFFKFNERILAEDHFKLRIITNALVHGTNRQFYVCSQDGVFFDENNCGRLTKASHFSYLNKGIKKIDEAIILPIPYASSNYYHNFSEMVYGLSHIEKFDNSLPIIFSENNYGILKEIARRAGIRLSRLYSLGDICDSTISRAYSILPSNFYWSPEFFNFFQKLAPTQKYMKKIYISRKNSSRSFLNEDEVELQLKSLGFEVFLLEKLSISQQIELFSNTNIVVAGHGAGITNIAYMQPRTTLIEIFEDYSIVPHFYLRSRHNQMKYRPIFSKERYVPIDDLVRSIKAS